MSERILLTVDDSQASARSVEYVSTMLAGTADRYVHLIHVLPPLAPASADAAARNLLGAMREQLMAAGMPGDQVDTGILAIPTMGELAEGLLDVARDQQCGTIVVGRNSLPWLREAFHHHPADELVKKAQGFTLWVVE